MRPSFVGFGSESKAHRYSRCSETWDGVVGHLGEPLNIDVQRMPISRVADVSSVVASVAHRFGPASAVVSVFRYDDKDDPYVFNQDRYQVPNLAAHPRFDEIVIRASTSVNENMREYLRENVFLYKERPGSDHWLKTIPSSITAITRKL
jgi:hypothetical protein